jgi:hypothetical protein
MLRQRFKGFSEVEINDYHELLRKACEPPGDAEAQFQLADRFLKNTAPEQKGVEVAVVWLKEAAETGHIKSLRKLFECYRNAEEGREVALGYLRRAAELGDAQSQHDLAWELFRARWHDRTEIVLWNRKAAEQGHTYAAWSLGQHYEEGDGTPKDLQKAVEWYRVAALRGHELAERKLEELAPNSSNN